MEGVSLTTHQSPIALESGVPKPGLRMNKIVGIAILTLSVGLATATGAAIAATVMFGSGIALAVAVVTTLALALLVIEGSYRQGRHLLPAPLQRLGDIVYAQVVDFFACCALGALVLNPFKKKDPTEVSPDAGRPILMVHGYLGHSSNWAYLRSRVNEAKLGPVFTIDLGHPLQAIDKDYAEKVKQKADEIRKITGRSDLILVGHSMGGVISSYYATHLAEPGTVTDVITLGSPLNGTHTAPIGIGECANQMRIGSALLTNIHDKLDGHEVRMMNLASDTDQFILPNSSALLDKERLQDRLITHTFEKMGHASYLFSDVAGDLLVDYLKSHST